MAISSVSAAFLPLDATVSYHQSFLHRVNSSIRVVSSYSSSHSSVSGGNSAERAKDEDIDGFLVDGASLKGPEFATIVNSVTSKKVDA